MAFICKDKKNTNRQIRVQNKIRFEKQKCFPLTLEGGLQIVPTSGGEGVKQKKKQKKHFILTNLQITIFSLRNKNWTLFLNKIFSRFISSIYKR